uniref:G domain-containing protein n=1 Tax=Panagrolaimus sp. PS1159 TaxID=55785 RepID=A0AC35FUQ7_9BILA
MSHELNLLVLGKTGTGKSTFINAVANYLTYRTFDEALAANKLTCLIPTYFILTNDKLEESVISCGTADKNENIEAGVSSTKAPRVYSFKSEDTVLNVIDVPGVCDNEGVEKDKQNFSAILDTVALFRELHGICILIKAAETVMTTEFSYAQSELLMHLHKNALDNVVFIFTNARGSGYNPGNSLMPLRRYLSELEKVKGIKVTLGVDNVFSVDNEGFRFQCAHHQHRQFRDINSTVFEESWTKSRDATFRLINRMKRVNPHNVIETISINEARAIIILLIQPLAVITGLIQNNAANYEDNFNEIVEQLQKNLAISDFDIKIEEIARPRTVCTATSCIGVEKLAGTNRYVTFYKKICHRACYLENVPLSHCPEPKLAFCTAMRGGENCHNCGCHHSKHMHIDFNQRTILKESQLNTRLQNFGNVISPQVAATELQATIQELHNEQRIVTETMVKYGGFLERLNMEIRKEEAVAQNSASNSVVNRLKIVQEKYREQRKNLEATIKTADGRCLIAPEEVLKLRDDLFKLPLHGGKIEELYNKSREKIVSNYSKKNFICVDANFMP